MKYDGLRKIETAARENVSVVNIKREEPPKKSRKEPVKKPPEEKTESAAADLKAETEADAPEKKSAPVSRRGILRLLTRQFVIAALVVGGLLLLKFADSGFAADVFQGVKDIISYNYEAAGPIYGEGATVVDAIFRFFT